MVRFSESSTVSCLCDSNSNCAVAISLVKNRMMSTEPQPVQTLMQRGHGHCLLAVYRN